MNPGGGTTLAGGAAATGGAYYVMVIVSWWMWLFHQINIPNEVFGAGVALFTPVVHVAGIKFYEWSGVKPPTSI